MNERAKAAIKQTTSGVRDTQWDGLIVALPLLALLIVVLLLLLLPLLLFIISFSSVSSDPLTFLPSFLSSALEFRSGEFTCETPVEFTRDGLLDPMTAWADCRLR